MEAAHPFADLELSLTPHEGSRYHLNLRLARQDDHTFQLSGPFSVELDLETLLAARSDLSDYGSILAGALFADEEAWDAFDRARAACLESLGALRLRLVLPDELQHICWERLSLRGSGNPVALESDLILSRYLSVRTYERIKLRPRSRLRALVAVASHEDLRAYKLEPVQETDYAAALAALAPLAPATLGVAGSPAATWNSLCDRLNEGYDILYLVAHGTCAGDRASLLLPDEHGRVHPHEAANLAAFVGGLKTKRPRLVVLASCESAGDGIAAAHAALGPLLARAGVPAVLAMQGQISLETARVFARVFFEELLRDGFADRALAVARSAVYHSGQPDWWAPVLYTRLLDGRIWADGPGPPIGGDPAQEAFDLLSQMPVEDERPIPAVTALPAGSQVKLPHNKLFVGREAELRWLARALRGPAPAAVGQAAAITGLGGVGKTNLASEFVHRYGQYFVGGVFWLSFASPDVAQSEVASCGGPGHLNLDPDGFAGLSLESRAALVRAEWQKPIPRLLVFDNCESEELFKHWFPSSGGSRVLLTSRRSPWPEALGVEELPLGVLLRGDSIALLRRHRPDITASNPGLRAIAAELGDLPLALHLAGSFLEVYRNDVTAAEYLDELRGPALLEHSSMIGVDSTPSPTNHELHVGRTFALSFNQLCGHQPVDALALRLLARLAHFELGASVERDLLCEAAGLQKTDPRLRQARRKLIVLGLLNMKDGGNSFALHRLVAQFGRTVADDAARGDVLDALRARMRSEPSLIERRTRAFQLTRLEWLADVKPVAPAELIAYAELIARHVASPATCAYLADGITVLLEPVPAPMSDREHGRLRVFRAAMRGQLLRQEEARADYEIAKQIVDRLIAQEPPAPEDYQLQAQINLGLANIKAMEAYDLAEDQAALRRQLLADAGEHYYASVAAASAYEHDPLLLSAALDQLCYCLALLHRWDDAEAAYQSTLDALGQSRARVDAQAYAHAYAAVLETGCMIYWEKGQTTGSADDYALAYRRAEQEIAFLAPDQTVESKESLLLYQAHTNAGDCQRELGRLGEQAAGGRTAETEASRAKACRHWSLALGLALRLGDRDKEIEIRERLGEHCSP